MILIGSVALKQHFPLMHRTPSDIDVVATESEIKTIHEKLVNSGKPFSFRQTKPYKFHILFECIHIEIETTSLVSNAMLWNSGNCFNDKMRLDMTLPTARVASLQQLYALKLHHKFSNSVHFEKTRKDILFFRSLGCGFDNDLLDRRTKDIPPRAHVKLNVDKESFFNDNVTYLYDHDTLHEIVAASIEGKGTPAYKLFQKDNEPVMSDMVKFVSLPLEVQLRAINEEAQVLSFERMIAHNYDCDWFAAYKRALRQICTVTTSGVFRETAWEHYDKLINNYTNYPIIKIINCIQNGLLKPLVARKHSAY